MKVKLSDIAEATGFSVNTVSRALRGDKRISERTRTIIAKMASELGYIPNAVAGAMRSKRTNIIGVVSADSSNPFFAEVILGIEDTARQNNYHILLINTEENGAAEMEAVALFRGRQVDGLIVIPVFGNDGTKALYECLDLPFIFAGRRIEGLENHSILHGDREGSRLVFDYLLERGHRRILYLAGPDYVSNSLDRRRGMIDAFAEQDLPIVSELMVETAGHLHDGYVVTNQILNRDTNFSAVACFNDMVAMGCLKSLHENGYSVPGDIEVFGYDNLCMAQYMQPRLSTVDVPKTSLGQRAVNELIRHINEEGYPYETINMNPRLIFRETTVR